MLVAKKRVPVDNEPGSAARAVHGARSAAATARESERGTIANRTTPNNFQEPFPVEMFLAKLAIATRQKSYLIGSKGEPKKH